MLRNIANLGTVEFQLNKGMHELSPSNRKNGYACLQQDWRVSPDGVRIEKRRGCATEISNFAEDVYGYATYIDASANFCELAVLESQIKRKVGAGAWGSIHTFSSSISHPVKVLDIQGKQFIINEVDSRFVHTDGGDYQIGITAPATLASVLLDYPTAILNETCAAHPGSWTESNGGSGGTSQATFQTFSCFRMQGTGNPADYTSNTQTLATAPGKRFTVEMKLYFDTFQHASGEVFWFYTAYSATQAFAFCTDGYRLVMNNIVPGRVGNVGIELVEDTWYTFKFYVDTENGSADVYVNGVYYGNYNVTYTSTFTAGETYFYCSGHYVASDVYMDYLKIYNSESSTSSGVAYRYAITYARSGNFGNESNPRKSLIGTDVFYGAGLDDLTPGGTYTGDQNRTIQVEIDGTGTPDTVKVSYDGGITWSALTVPITTTMYLSYGVTVTFGATTGHTSANYWSFTCQAMAVRKYPTEKTLFTAIPASGDAQVNQRKIYRSVAGGATFFWMATLNDNTATTYSESTIDAHLGDEAAEDHDVMPNGNFPVWWDNRLWVFTDDTGYYSAIDNPEAFDIDDRFITIRKGTEGDETTGAIEYKDSLYVFKRNDIFIIIKKPDGAYGRYHLNNFGCDAPWSIIEVNDLLMFKSQNGIELYNGLSRISNTFSMPMLKTILSVDPSKLDYVTAMRVKPKNEIWFSFPDLLSHWTTKGELVVVYNDVADAWYWFHYGSTKKISCMVECRNSTGAIVNKLGTRDGYLGLAESGYTDFANTIYATCYTEHATFYEGCDIEFAEFEYECPVSKNITVKWYADMNDTEKKDDSLAGSTPTGQYADMYRLEYRAVELGLRAKNLQLLLYNAENPGGDVKVNNVLVYFHPRRAKGDYSGQ